MSSTPASIQSASLLAGDADLAAVQRQLEAIQDQKQAFLQDLVPLPAQSSVSLSAAAPSSGSVRDLPDLAQFLRDAAQFDRELHFEYCSLNSQSTAERSAVLQQYSSWQAEDTRRLAELAAKRRALQAAYIAEREAALIRDYEDRLAQLQQENGRLRAALAAAQSGRRPDLGLEVAGTYQRGQRGVEVVNVNGAALEAGAEVGDTVVGVGWHSKVDSAAVYGDAAARVRPGDLVTIDAYRHGRPISFHIVAKAPGPEPLGIRNPSGRRPIERRLFCFPVTDQRSALDTLNHPSPSVPPASLLPHELQDEPPPASHPAADVWPIDSEPHPQWRSPPSVGSHSHSRPSSSTGSRFAGAHNHAQELVFGPAVVSSPLLAPYNPSPSRVFAYSPHRGDPQRPWR